MAKERKYLALTAAIPLERTREFVRENVLTDVAQFVAVHEGQVVGWADILPLWPPTMAHCGRLGMGVLEVYRGHGIGAKLLKACIAKAKAKGITRVELEARADNRRAIHFYERVGFIHECRKRNAMRFEGVYFDSIQMCLLMGDAIG